MIEVEKTEDGSLVINLPNSEYFNLNLYQKLQSKLEEYYFEHDSEQTFKKMNFEINSIIDSHVRSKKIEDLII